MFGVDLRIAARNLVQARRRTLPLVLGLVFASMLFVLMTALTRGMRTNLLEAATILAAGHVNVGGFFKTTPTDVVPILSEVGRLRRDLAEIAPDAPLIVDRHRGFARIISDRASVMAGVFGIDPREEVKLLQRLQIANEHDVLPDGRDLPAGRIDDVAAPGTITLFATQAKRLGVTVGDAVTIRSETFRGQTNTADATVGAVLRDIGLMSGWRVFVPKATVRELYALTADTSGVAMVYGRDIERTDELMLQLRDGLSRRGWDVLPHDDTFFFFKLDQFGGEDWTGQRLDLTTWRDEVSVLEWVVRAIEGLSVLVVGILLVIIGVGVTNTMWIAVRERTREIGTLRAMGMQRGRVMRLFLAEAALIGVAGTGAGVAVGIVVALVLEAAAIDLRLDAVRAILLSDSLHLEVEPVAVLIAALGFPLVTATAALWPARRAAALPPASAMHFTE